MKIQEQTFWRRKTTVRSLGCNFGSSRSHQATPPATDKWNCISECVIQSHKQNSSQDIRCPLFKSIQLYHIVQDSRNHQSIWTESWMFQFAWIANASATPTFKGGRCLPGAWCLQLCRIADTVQTYTLEGPSLSTVRYPAVPCLPRYGYRI